MSNEATQFKPGEGGRPKGAVNKTTAEIREALQAIYTKNLVKLESDLEKMTPFQRQQILDKLSNKFLPNLTKNENETMTSGEIKISIQYGTATPTPTPVKLDEPKLIEPPLDLATLQPIAEALELPF